MQQFKHDFFSCLEYNLFSKKLYTLLGILRRSLGKGSSIEISQERRKQSSSKTTTSSNLQNTERWNYMIIEIFGRDIKSLKGG